MKDILISIASTVILALVTWISERLIALINAKIRNQRFAHYLTAAVAAVTDAVKATQQEYVDGLKKSGQFNEAAAKEALGIAKDKVMQALSLETRTFIDNNIGDVNRWIETTIHSTLHDMKEKINGNKN
nr:MAG TPA: holin [Caudoviricetes sp.]